MLRMGMMSCLRKATPNSTDRWGWQAAWKDQGGQIGGYCSKAGENGRGGEGVGGGGGGGRRGRGKGQGGSQLRLPTVLRV